ncbi:oxidoreductase [Tessaracoccus lapidicaptus]|uniref:Oxidoreductase n=1 Tax=Tessaracoccus lapidicaptus TaxID=1427523 RepID=A0A1C0AMD7_9ACTN|nr:MULTISPECIES: Gfo/Idh/MocA family oxidoreductase [Tessaracoccus]AQX15560.1 oxidoreductase [Tessaracoccus sp. T2.5-30]OCL33930.1 oxidoreductase [Tessaracoccus lapidicaptus]VEP39901.1 1,5-anhydro-D-fructose reductase [Tessaracoccus lapidicaptus]
MTTVRWGIVGTGAIAHGVAGDFQFVPGAELTAVASRTWAKARDFAAEHQVPKAFGSYRELLDSPDIDVVYIATPHPQHRDVALAAIERGKAVLVEKAFTATLAGARQVVDAARAKGVFAMEAMWTRFLPVIAAAREVVAWGRIGDVVGVQGDLYAFREYQPDHRLFSRELGGGAILDLGVYPINVAQAFLGEVKEIDCRARLYPSGVERAATVNLVHAGEGLSSLTFGFDGYGPGRLIVVGTKGWIEIEPRFHHPSMITVHRNGVLPRIIEAMPTGRGYSHEFAEVTQRIREGATESPTMPLSDTLEVMRVLEKCLRQSGVTHQEAAVDLG